MEKIITEPDLTKLIQEMERRGVDPIAALEVTPEGVILQATEKHLKGEKDESDNRVPGVQEQ